MIGGATGYIWDGVMSFNGKNNSVLTDELTTGCRLDISWVQDKTQQG